MIESFSRLIQPFTGHRTNRDNQPPNQNQAVNQSQRMQWIALSSLPLAAIYSITFRTPPPYAMMATLLAGTVTLNTMTALARRKEPKPPKNLILISTQVHALILSFLPEKDRYHAALAYKPFSQALPLAREKRSMTTWEFGKYLDFCFKQLQLPKQFVFTALDTIGKLDAEKKQALIKLLRRQLSIDQFSIAASGDKIFKQQIALILQFASRLRSLGIVNGNDQYKCYCLKDISSITALSSLQELTVRNCNHITNYDVIENIPSLVSLDISYTNMTNFRVIEKLPNLHTLHVYCIEKGVHFQLTKPLPQIIDAILQFPSIDTTSLENLPNLRKLTLRITQPSSSSFLKEMPYLTELKLYGAQFLTDFDGFNEGQLRTLHMNSVGPIDLAPLGNLQELRNLLLTSSRFINVRSLANCQNLRQLELYGTDHEEDYQKILVFWRHYLISSG